jgi:hypothetical protein
LGKRATGEDIAGLYDPRTKNLNQYLRETSSESKKWMPHPLAEDLSFFTMRLLSFLTEIERAIRMESNADETSIWDAARIVNFKTGLARLTLTVREADSGMPQGSVLVQHFGLANGSFCVKANLSWDGSDASTIISVYDTPTLNWKLESARIASTWLAGPPAGGMTVSIDGHIGVQQVAVAG